jgi:hypothetical protein
MIYQSISWLHNCPALGNNDINQRKVPNIAVGGSGASRARQYPAPNKKIFT